LAVIFRWPSQGFAVDLNPFFFQVFAVFPCQENLVAKEYPGIAAIGMFKIFYLHFQIRTFIVGIPAEPVYPAESVHLTDVDFRSKFGFRFVFSPDNRTHMGLENVHNAVLALMGSILIHQFLLAVNFPNGCHQFPVAFFQQFRPTGF